MKKDEILSLLKEFAKKNSNPYFYSTGSYGRFCGDKENEVFEGFRSESWLIGGVEGGSCWNEGGHSSISAESHAKVTLLDKFLEEAMPEISFLKYKKIEALIKTESYTSSEYYGNYKEYSISYISFDDIADFLANVENVPKAKIKP